MRRLLIGLAGAGGSGKDTVAEMLEQHGIRHISTGDLVRKEIRKRREQVSRKRQTEIANELRLINAGHWVQSALDEGLDNESLCVSGLYAPSEVESLKHKGGVMVFIGSLTESNAHRIQQRSDGERDKLTTDEITESQKRESSGKEKWEANLASVYELSDWYINNNSDLHTLRLEVDKLYRKLVRGQA